MQCSYRGVGDIAQKFVESINKYGDWGLRIVGFIVKEVQEHSTFGYAPILGNFQSISRILHQNPIDEVIFALPLKDLEDAKEMIEICEVEGVKTRFITHFFGVLILKAEADIIHGIPIITYSPTSRKVWELVIKRTIDILVSAIFLILLSPIFLIIAFLIKVTSAGPVK